MVVLTTLCLWTTALCLAAEPAATGPALAAPLAPAPAAVSEPAGIARPTPARRYKVLVRIIEIDAAGQETIVAQPVLQTAGAAAGVAVDHETGRRFEFHFSAAEPGAPAPLPISLDEAAPRPIAGTPPAAPTALQRKISVKAVQQPRKDVLRDVARQAGLTLALEPETAAAAALQLAAPISLQIDNAPVQHVLQQLVEPLDVVYSIHHDLILIGAQRATAAAPELMPPPTQSEPLPLPMPIAAEAPAPMPKGSSTAKPDWQVRVYGVADIVTYDDATGQPRLAPLMQQLQQQVLPQSWSATDGGSIRAFESTISLVVRQTTEGHLAVTRFIEQQRRAASASAKAGSAAPR